MHTIGMLCTLEIDVCTDASVDTVSHYKRNVGNKDKLWKNSRGCISHTEEFCVAIRR